MGSLISGENILLVWMVVACMATFAIYAEQKFKWGGYIGSAVIAIFLSMILCSLHITPTSSAVYGGISSYVLPLSIPLLLFKCDVRKIIRESGRLFLLWHVAAVGTIIGSLFCGFVLFRNAGQISAVSAMVTGAYTGGTVNLVAMGETFHADAAYVNACAVGANVLLGFCMLLLSVGASTGFVRKNFSHPYIDAFEAGTDNTKSQAAQYWKPKNISLLSIGMCLATTFVITGVSSIICNLVNATNPPLVIGQLFGSIYLVMTLVTVVLVTIFPKYFEKLEGAEELGNYMIVLWFTTLGCAATLQDVFATGYVLVYMAIVIVLNLVVCLGIGKLCKGTYEELATATCATIGGPTTAAALAINKGWGDLIVPGILVGLYGYITGNYLGVLVGDLLM